MDEHGMEPKRARAIRREPSGAGYAGAFDAERAGVVADGDAAQGYAVWTAANSGGERAAAAVGGANNPKDALAAFDFGYLVECYKQASWLHQHTDWLKASGDPTGANLATKVDGYSWVVKAITLRGSDPQMEFAAALMTTDGARSEHERHLQSGMAGAKADAMLARNLSSRFPKSAA